MAPRRFKRRLGPESIRHDVRDGTFRPGGPVAQGDTQRGHGEAERLVPSYPLPGTKHVSDQELQMNIAGSSHWFVALFLGNRSTAGTPTATAPAGTSLTTTALAPTWVSSPTVTGPRIRAGADGDAVAHRRVALDPRQRAPTERDAVVDHDVVADLRGLADDDAHPVSMKKRRPMRAPGWISTPVTDRVTVARTRAGSRPGQFPQRAGPGVPRWRAAR